MKLRIAEIAAASIYNQKGLFNAVHNRIIHLAKVSDYKIDKQAADYQFLSNTGYTLEKRKNRANFKSEVTKVLQNIVFPPKVR